MNKKYEEGLKVRKSVLGKEHVEKSLKNADDFTEEMQNLTTEYCWGAVWTRDGLEKRERSLINLGMLIALGKPNEFQLHVKGALRNGVTQEEIKEVVMQAAIYCGIPAGMDSIKLAKEAILEYNETDV